MIFPPETRFVDASPRSHSPADVELEISASTVADALSALCALHPGVRDHVVTEQGQVREHINIFAADENIRYTGGLATPLAANSEISIVPAVSGG